MKKLNFLVFLLVTAFLNAQKVTVTANKSKIKIGEEIVISLKTAVNASDFVTFPETDTIGKMEVINSYKIENITEKNQKFIIKKYGITQFDAGKYNLPPIELVYNKQKLKTNTLQFEVQDVLVDTTKQKMFDIKAEKQLNLDITNNLTPIINKTHLFLALFLVVLLTFLVFFILKKFLGQNSEKTVYQSPIIEFKQAISNCNTTNNDKIFYSEITHFTRRYFNRTLEISALESTTSKFITDLKIAIKNNNFNINSSILEQLNKVFNNADMVKFAKTKADQKYLIEDKNQLEIIINQFHDNLPQSNEEIKAQQTENERILNEKQLAKKRKLFTFLSLIAFLTIAFFSLGYSNLKQFYSYHFETRNANYYLKQNWISSVYGEPGLEIETPLVLERSTESVKSPYIKAASKFFWNKSSDNISITIKIISYKDSVKTNPNEIFNVEIADLTKQGAKIINSNIYKFETPKGIQGQKNSGNFLTVNNQEATFHQYFIDGGTYHQILNITIFKADEKANEFLDKIQNSLQIINPEEDE